MDDHYKETASRNAYRTANAIEDASTSWGELKAAGKNVVEASSTTYDKNSRFILFVNNELKTHTEFDNLITKSGPLYQMTVQPGETYVIQGKNRNDYVPGLDYTAAFSSQFNDASGDTDNIAPPGIRIIQGFGDFKDGTLTGVANPDAGTFEGIPVVFTETDAKIGVYQDGTLMNSKSLTAGEWHNNPFEIDRFDYDLSKFSVKRQEGNLYGSGSQNVHMKLRDKNTGKEEYLKIGEVGDPDDPIIDTFNLYNTIRVEVDASRSDPFTFSVGPLQFFNEGNIDTPTRGKQSTKRNIAVSATFGDVTGTVFAVYRKDPNNPEVPVQVRCGAKAQTDGRVEIREVHRDFLGFGTIDPDLDSNWGPPDLLRARETGIQELAMTPGDVTLASSNNRAEGEQSAVVEYDGQDTKGGQSQPRESSDAERINEYHYFVATARHQSTAEDLIRYDLFTEEAW